MEILAFAASSSSRSINRALVGHAAKRLGTMLGPEATLRALDLNDYEMPIFSADRQRAGGIPEEAKRFYAQIGEADALLISFAEHNGSYTAAYKNVYDWASRIDSKVYQGKPIVALSTSPGRRGGASVLGHVVASIPHFGAQVVDSLSVPSFNDNFDREAGTLTDPDLAAALDAALAKLVDRLAAPHGG